MLTVDAAMPVAKASLGMSFTAASLLPRSGINAIDWVTGEVSLTLSKASSASTVDWKAAECIDAIAPSCG